MRGGVNIWREVCLLMLRSCFFVGLIVGRLELYWVEGLSVFGLYYVESSDLFAFK